jgi:hypothetical protein
VFQDWQLDSERTYRAIGRLMYEFSQLEYALRHAVGDELKQEHFVETISVFDVGVLCTLAIKRSDLLAQAPQDEGIKPLMTQ